MKFGNMPSVFCWQFYHPFSKLWSKILILVLSQHVWQDQWQGLKSFSKYISLFPKLSPILPRTIFGTILETILGTILGTFFLGGTLYWNWFCIVIWGCFSQNDKFVQNWIQGHLWYHIRSGKLPKAIFVTKKLLETDRIG